MSATQNKGLGKGLSVLISEEYSKSISQDERGGEGQKMMGIDRIISGQFQPRHHFSEEYLGELAQSIHKNGIMQPIIVRPVRNAQYEIIAGERRWRAAKMAGLLEVPVIVRDVEDRQALELALIENIQRQDLSPLEEAGGFQRLIDEFGHTQEELASVVGKSRSHVANLLRLLTLPAAIKDLLGQGKISMGHARALLNAGDPIALAEEVVRRGLNVRQTEHLCRGDVPGALEQNAPPKSPSSRASRAETSAAAMPAQRQKDEDTVALERMLSTRLGMPVEIAASGQSGQITVHYDSLTQLDQVIRALSGGF
jgi:ParB family chromosome partitioning protein